MTVTLRSLVRRALLGGLAIVLAAAGLGLAAAWTKGSEIWPPTETRPDRRIGTDPAAIEAAVAGGDPAAPIRIGIVGDIQNGISELCDLLDSFRDENVDFIVQLGDAANVGLPGRYAVLRHVFETHAAGIPVIAVPGNHDIEPDKTTTMWAEWVGPPEWRLDVRGWRILGLDDADGRISPASVALLERAAKDSAPLHGTILVAHRPLGAAEATDGIDGRARQIAATGLVPSITLSGHWHRNDQHVDPKGTVHVQLGENCDRASSGVDLPVSHAVLRLFSSHELNISRIPRRITFSGEFLRTAVASVYPPLRGRPLLAWTAIGLALATSAFLARAALRRPHPSPA